MYRVSEDVINEIRLNVDTYEVAKVTTVLDLDSRLPAFIQKLERPVLPISLDFSIVEFATDEPLRVENRVFRIGMKGIFGRVANPELNAGGVSEHAAIKCIITHSRSSSVKLTQEGVIRWPWSLAIISTRPPR
jgi:NAD-specific glutamate dehydrogenase